MSQQVEGCPKGMRVKRLYGNELGFPEGPYYAELEPILPGEITDTERMAAALLELRAYAWAEENAVVLRIIDSAMRGKP